MTAYQARQDRARACLDCGGAGHKPRTGWHPVAVFECETCHGTGTEIVERRAAGRIDALRIDPPLHAVECEDCHGSGTVKAHGDYAARISCPSCGGGGTVLDPLSRADDMPRQLPITALLDVLQAGPPETVGYGDVGAPAFQHGWRAALDHVWNHLQVAALLEAGTDRQETPAPAPEPASRTIRIPRYDQHEGHAFLEVTLPWVCIHCGQPRGEPTDGLSFDGSRRLFVHCWKNPCGHIETYPEIRDWLEHQEASAALAQQAAAPDPVPALVDACGIAADWLATDTESMRRVADRIADWCADHAQEANQATAVGAVRWYLLNAIRLAQTAGAAVPLYLQNAARADG